MSTQSRAPGSVVPIVLSIDVEPDPSWPEPGKPDPWLGFEAWLEYVAPLRDRLAGATGRPVRFNWALRLDDQVTGVYGSPSWVAETYAKGFETLRHAGDELGVHPHAWRWEDPPGRWLQDHGNQEWVNHVIHTSFNAFKASFGYDCTVHRYGSRFINAGIVRTLRELNVKVDMTVEPGARGMVALESSVPATGYLRDQGYAPRVPYQPSDDDPLAVAANGTDGPIANDGLWMLPATSFDPAPWLSPSRRLARKVRFAGRPLHRPAELWAPVEPQAFWKLAMSAADDLPTPYISLAVRSDSLISSRLAAPIKGKLEALLDAPWASRLAFMTATEAVRHLTGSESSSAANE